MKCVIYPFALASEASTLDCTAVSKVCEQLLWWKGKPSASRIWSQRCKRVNWMQHLSTRIFTDSLGQSIEDAWILSAAAFPASRSVRQVCVKRPKILDTCGPSSSQGLLFSDLGLASSRMLTGSSTHQVRDTIPFCTMSSATWNDWVSDRRQAASQRQKLAHHTSGSDGSSSVFATPTSTANQTSPSMMKHPCCQAIVNWPTPTTKDQDEPYLSQVNRNTTPLHIQVNWPTPTTSDNKNGASEADLRRETPPLRTLAAANWPTPTASEGDKVSNCPNYAQTSLGNHPTLVGLPQRTRNSTKNTDGLRVQAKPNLDGKQGVLLNAAWVDQLMGFPENWSNVQIEGTD